ncbi:glycine cleavage system aminomethyltransferase GcvT [Planctomycetota bacterium]
MMTERTALYHQHIQLTDKSHIVPFAGYLMPLWYSSISEEHAAVRDAAGIFDCTHMGVLGISGVGATEFLNELTTSNIENLKSGHAKYSFILDASGNVLDDVIVFRKDSEDFILVVNAVNNAKIKNWIDSLLNNQVCIEPNDTNRKISGRPEVQDLRIADGENDCRVDIALQGPKSLEILSALIRDSEVLSQMTDLRPFQFIEVDIKGISYLLSRTGYTGARIGFELFVHPEKASPLWEAILQAGEPLGLLPCGLGSRDSLRIEAGFPLYGHELAGEFDISPFEAGYGWAVKLEKEFFIGKAAMERISTKCDMKVARIELPGTKGTRPVRQNDGVLDEHGRSIGWVLSCAMIGEKQIALVYIDAEPVEENKTIGICYLARSQRQVQQGRKQRIEKGELLEPDLTGRVVSRFAKF